MNLQFENYKKEIKKIYYTSFPKEERFPFWILKHSIKSGNVVLNSITNNDELIGMSYIVNCDDSSYLMYFAIKKELRNKGYGSSVLKQLKEKYDILFLSIEKLNDEFSIKRKKFYLKNGFYETGKFYIDANVEYEILCTNKNYKIKEEIMKKRYINMSNSKLVKFIIGKIFNMNNIRFINK